MDFFAVACALQPVGSFVLLTQNDRFFVILSYYFYFIIPINLVILSYYFYFIIPINLVILSVAKYPKTLYLVILSFRKKAKYP